MEFVAPLLMAARPSAPVMLGKASAARIRNAEETLNAAQMKFVVLQLMDAQSSVPALLENRAVAKMTNAEET